MSNSTRSFAVSLTALAALGLTLTACSDSDEDAAANEADACSAIDTFQTEVAKIGTLTPESSVDEIRAVREDIQGAYRELVTELDDVADDRYVELDKAYDAFNDSVDDLDDDATLTEALASLQEEAATVRDAEAAVADDLECD